jgi:hypothetical protein
MNIIYVAYFMMINHPHQQVYFSVLAGDRKKIADRLWRVELSFCETYNSNWNSIKIGSD